MPDALLVLLPDSKACNAQIIRDISNHQRDEARVGQERETQGDPYEDRRVARRSLDERRPNKLRNERKETKTWKSIKRGTP
jgi:hypothetical protein